jgi:hypothetical protein
MLDKKDRMTKTPFFPLSRFLCLIVSSSSSHDVKLRCLRHDGLRRPSWRLSLGTLAAACAHALVAPAAARAHALVATTVLAPTVGIY